MPLPSEKIFAVGDIHGCLDRLITLLGRIPYDQETDTLIFLGDYINRGPDSKKVLDYLIELKLKCKNVVFLMGNHEQVLLEYSATGDVDSLNFLRMMGVGSTVESYGTSIRQLQGLACFSQEHKDFLHTLSFAFIAGNTIFTHADINEEFIALGKSGAEIVGYPYHSEAALLSSRRLVREEADTYGYTIVFGHSPFELPLVLPDRICIDTGAVYGNVLTAIELPKMRFYHA